MLIQYLHIHIYLYLQINSLTIPWYTLHYIHLSHTTCDMAYTNLPSVGQYQLMGLKLRWTSDKDVLRLMPKRIWWQNTLGRVTLLLSVNVSRVLFSSSALSTFCKTSWSIACRITHQHILSCNGMGRITNCHCHTLHTASGCHPHSYCMRH